MSLLATTEVKISEIPHGHGLSFKKGVADGLLKDKIHLDGVPETHKASYNNGFKLGEQLAQSIGKCVK